MDANTYSVSTWGGEIFSDLVMPSDPNSKVKVRRLNISMLAASGMLERMDQISPTVEENVRGPAQGKQKPSKSGNPAKKQPQDRQPKKLTKAEQEEAAKADLGGEELKIMMDMMSVLIPKIIVEPKVLPSMYVDPDTDKMIEVNPEDREAGAIYSDTIPINDQMHIFSWAMEDMDMEEVQKFREQQPEDVEPVADESGVSRETE